MRPSPHIDHLAVDSDLGRFDLVQWRPPSLARLVQQIWYFEGQTAFARERTFPDGTAQIIVQLGARYRDVRGDLCEVCPASCVSGLQTGPVVIEAPGCSNAVLGIRLRPEGAFALFGSVLADTADLTVDLRDLGRSAAGELAERCEAAQSPQGRLAAAARWIGQHVARGRRADPAISWMAGEIEARRGAVSIDALRERAGIAKTRLAATFRAQIGLTPKRFARVHRFRHLLALFDRSTSGRPSLAELSLDAGYYDQAHMNAEFREIAGTTPSAFLDAVRYPNSVSLAEGAR